MVTLLDIMVIVSSTTGGKGKTMERLHRVSFEKELLRSALRHLGPSAVPVDERQDGLQTTREGLLSFGETM